MLPVWRFYIRVGLEKVLHVCAHWNTTGCRPLVRGNFSEEFIVTKKITGNIFYVELYVALAAAVLRSTVDFVSKRLAAALLLQLARHQSLRARLLALAPWLALAQV